MVFSGAALPAPYSILEVGPLGPAGGAAEGPELGYGAPKHSVSRVATVTVNPVDSLGSVNGLTLYCQWTVRVNVTVHITLRTCVRPGATENFVTENDETDGL